MQSRGRVRIDLGTSADLGADGPDLGRCDAVVEMLGTLRCYVSGVDADAVTAEVRAALWDDTRTRANVYATVVKATRVRSHFELDVPLVAGAFHRISFRSTRAPLGFKTVYASAHPALFPEVYALLKQDTVTEEELQEELARMLELALKASAELGSCAEGGPITLEDVPVSVTGRIDPEGGNDLSNVRTRISRPQLREGLLAIKCAPSEEERARRRADLTNQEVSQMLHELAHRRRFRDGQVNHRDPPGEEDAATTDVIGRAITLLEQLAPRLASPPPDEPPPLGDGAGLEGEDVAEWFARMRVVVCRQVIYRFNRVAGMHEPHKTRFDRVKAAWQAFMARLRELRSDAQMAQGDKQTAAQAAFDQFNAATSDDRSALDSAFDVRWTFELDVDALTAHVDLDCTDTFGGRPIPVIH